MEIDGKKVIFEDENKALFLKMTTNLDGTTILYLRVEEISDCLMGIADSKKKIETLKMNHIDEYGAEAVRKIHEGEMDYYAACARIWKGCALDESCTSLVADLMKMCSNWVKTEYRLAFQAHGTPFESSPGYYKSFVEARAEECFMNMQVRCSSDVDHMIEICKSINGNTEDFRVVIDYMKEDEFCYYMKKKVQKALLNWCGRVMSVKEMYTDQDVERVELFKKSTGEIEIKEDDFVVENGFLKILTNSRPDADQILNKGLSNSSLKNLIDMVRLLCKEAADIIGEGEDLKVRIDKLHERGLLSLMRSMCNKVDRMTFDIEKRSGLSIAVYVLEKRCSARGKTVNSLFISPLRLFFESYVFRGKGNRRVYRDLHDMLSDKSIASNLAATETLGRIKGFCAEFLMCDIFNVTYYKDDREKAIHNAPIVSQDARFVKSSIKTERLSITDIVKDTTTGTVGDVSRGRVRIIFDELSQMDSNKVVVNKSEKFDMMKSNCYIEVGCKNRCKEKADIDFEKLKSMLDEDACYASICFSKMSDLISFSNRSKIKKLLNATFDMKTMDEQDELFDYDPEESATLFSCISTTGVKAEQSLKTIVGESWGTDIFEKAKSSLGSVRQSRMNYSNCSYINKKLREEIIKHNNTMLMDDLGFKCEKLRSLVEERKVKTEASSNMTVKQIENTVLAAVEKAKRDLGGKKRFVEASNRRAYDFLTETLYKVTRSKKKNINFFNEEGLNLKNSCYVKTEGEFREDSCQILIGLNSKYLDEKVGERLSKLKKVSQIGDINTGDIIISSKFEESLEKETNVLRLLTGLGERSSYSKIDCSTTISSLLIHDLCYRGEIETCDLLSNCFISRKKVCYRDVYKNVINVADDVIVRGFKTNEKVVKLIKSDVYKLNSICSGAKLNEENEVEGYYCEVTKEDKAESFMTAFWTSFSMLICLVTKKDINNRKLLEEGVKMSRLMRKNIGEKGKKEIVTSDERRELRNAEFMLTGGDDPDGLIMKNIISRTKENIRSKMFCNVERGDAMLKKFKIELDRVRYDIINELKKYENQIPLWKMQDWLKKLCVTLLVKIERIGNDSEVDIVKPCWFDHLSDICCHSLYTDRGFDKFLMKYDHEEIISAAKKSIKLALIIPKTLNDVVELLKLTGNSDMAEKCEEMSLPEVRRRYILSREEILAEDVCRGFLSSRKDNNVKLDKLLNNTATEEEKDESRRKNEPENVLFDMKFCEYIGGEDNYDEMHEFEAVKKAMCFEHTIGTAISNTHRRFMMRIRQEPEYKRSVFERSIARQIVRIKSRYSKSRQFIISTEVKGFACFLVCKKTQMDSHIYEFCLYDKEGNIAGPMMINEQKLNFLLSGPGVIATCTLGHIDNCSLGQDDYVQTMSGVYSDARIDTKREMKRILNLVMKFDHILMKIDVKILIHFVHTLLYGEGIYEDLRAGLVEEECIREIKENTIVLRDSVKNEAFSIYLDWVSSEEFTFEENVNAVNDVLKINLDVYERELFESFLTTCALNHLCKVFRLTKKLSTTGIKVQDRFLSVFLSTTFKCMKENNPMTNEQVQKTRFLAMHKLGCAGAYHDFGQKLYTEGRKASIFFSRLQQVWSAMYGCIHNSKEYLCTQSDLAGTRNMKHLVTEMYYNQYYCKMLLNNIESVKEVSLKVFDKVVDWKKRISEIMCKGGEECFCGSSEVEDMKAKTEFNCLMCLNVYRDTDIVDEIKYCVTKQNKFASSSPKMTRYLTEHFFLKNEVDLKANLRTSHSLEDNDMIGMAKSTGMVESLARSVSLSDAYKGSFWKVLSSLKGVILNKSQFSCDLNEKSQMKDVGSKLERFLASRDCKEEQEVLLEEKKVLDTMAKRVEDALSKMGSDDEVFKRTAFGPISQFLFKTNLELKKDLKSKLKNANTLISVMKRGIFARKCFFKTSVVTKESIEDENEKFEISKDKIERICNFYLSIIESSKFRGVSEEEVVHMDVESDKLKGSFKSSFEIEVNSVSDVVRPKDEGRKVLNTPMAYLKKKRDVNLSFDEDFRRHVKAIVNSTKAMDIGMVRVVSNNTFLLKKENVVLDDEKNKWDYFDMEENSFDQEDLRSVSIGESVMFEFKKILNDVQNSGDIILSEEGECDILIKDCIDHLESWPVYVDKDNRIVRVNESKLTDLKDDEFSARLGGVLSAVLNTCGNEVVIRDERTTGDFKRASELKSVLKKLKKMFETKKISLSFKVNDDKKTKIVKECFEKAYTISEKWTAEIISLNMEKLKGSFIEGVYENFDRLFSNCDFILKIKELQQRIEAVDSMMEKLTMNQRNAIYDNMVYNNKINENKDDLMVEKVMKDQKVIVKNLISVMTEYEKMVDLFMLIGSFFCFRGLLKYQKMDVSIVPFSLDLDETASQFFSSHEVERSFLLCCIYKKTEKEKLYHVLFDNIIRGDTKKSQDLDWSKLTMKKNFLYNFYEIISFDNVKIKNHIRRSCKYNIENAKRNIGAILVGRDVYSAGENRLLWEECINLLTRKKDVRHQTTIAPKNQLGAPRDLKVQTLDSCKLQATIEMVSSDVFRVMPNNAITDKFCKSRYLKEVQSFQKDINRERKYLYMSMDGESWGPKMKGDHVIKITSNLCRMSGFDELADVCDVIGEIWGNRESEISGNLIDGYMRSMINKRLKLEMGLDKLLDSLFEKKDNLNRYLFKNLFEGKKVVTLPIHMGQGLLQSTSTGIQALTTGFLESTSGEIDASIVMMKSIAGSDDKSITVCLENHDSLNISIKNILDTEQIVGSSMNINNSCKGVGSFDVCEMHSVFVSSGDQIPSKEKFNSGALMIGKDSSLKGHFESSYNLMRQLIQNSGDVMDCFHFLFFRCICILGTLDMKARRNFMECMCGPLSMGGFPPFEIVNYSLMKKENFSDETRLVTVLRKHGTGIVMNRAEKAVLCNYFLEGEKDYETGSVFLQKTTAKVSKQLAEIAEEVPFVSIPDEKMNFVKLAMSQNRVGNPRVDTLRMMQSLVAMNRSGSMRNEDYLSVLHQFHMNCSYKNVVVSNLPQKIGDMIRNKISREQQGRLKVQTDLCSVGDMLDTYEEYFNKNTLDIINFCYRLNSYKKAECKRVLRLFETYIVSEDRIHSKVHNKVVLFDSRTTNLTNSTLNIILWNADRKMLSELNIKSLDETEIQDDTFRLKMLDEAAFFRTLKAVEELETVTGDKLMDKISLIKELTDKMEGKTITSSITIGANVSGYHNAPRAFMETCIVKGSRFRFTDDQLPDYVGNSFRGLAKEVIGFICSFVSNEQQAKNMIRRALSRKLNEEESQEFGCAGSIMLGLTYSKNKQDNDFLRLHQKVVDEDLVDNYSYTSDVVTSDIYCYYNEDKSIIDFVLNNGAKLRLFINTDLGAFFQGCRADQDDLTRIVFKCFELITETSDIQKIRKMIRRMRMLDCTSDVEKIGLSIDGKARIGFEGIPFIEEGLETSTYKGKGELVRVMKSKTKKTKYGFEYEQEILFSKTKEQDMEELETLGDDQNDILSTFKAEVIKTRHTGSKVFSEAIIRLCVKTLSEEDTIVIRLRSNYGDSFTNMIDFIKNAKVQRDNSKRIHIKAQEMLLQERFVETRHSRDVKSVSDGSTIYLSYTNKEKEEIMIDTTEYMRLTKSINILLNKVVRDSQIIVTLKENYSSVVMETALAAIDTGFTKDLMRLNESGLSEAIAYFFNYYTIESDILGNIFSMKDYFKQKDNFFSKYGRLLTFNGQNRALKTRDERNSIVLKDSTKSFDRLRNTYNADMENFVKSRFSLSKIKKREIINKMNEREAIVSSETLDLNEVFSMKDSPYEKQEKVRERIMQIYGRVKNKILRLIDCSLEVLFIDDMKKFSYDEKTEFLSNMFCPEIESLKMKESGPLGFGLYIELRKEEGTSLLVVDICLRTGLDFSMNSRIKNIINSDEVQDCLKKILSYSREMASAKKLIQKRNEQQGETGDSKYVEKKRQGGLEVVEFEDLFMGMEMTDGELVTSTPQSTLESAEKSQGEIFDNNSESDISDYEGAVDSVDLEEMGFFD